MCLGLPGAGITGTHYRSLLFRWALGIELGSSHLHGTHAGPSQVPSSCIGFIKFNLQHRQKQGLECDSLPGLWVTPFKALATE